MPTEEDFLAAIEADPDADAPRLAHADWLEARDRRRAEFIRLEVRAARLPFAERYEASTRAHELLAPNRKRWLAGRPEEKGIEWRFVRGYPEEVTFSRAPAYKAAWRRCLVPPLRWVRFTGFRDVARIAGSPGLARVRWLALDLWKTPGDPLPVVLGSPHLAALWGLAVRRTRCTGATLELVASHPKLAGLRELNLGGCGEGEVAPGQVAALAVLEDLRALDLWGWRLHNAAARALWEAGPARLASLRLRQCQLKGALLEGLTGASLPSLEALDLSNNRLGDEGAVSVARAMRQTRLRKLNLEGNLVGDAGAAALAALALEELSLSDNAVGDAGATALANSARFGSLSWLTLSANLIGDAGMRALGRSTSLPRLRRLPLDRNPATDELIQAVSARFESGGPPPAEGPASAAPARQAPADAGGQADEDALVRALLADPWDQLARLAYADWLEENGSPLHARLMRAEGGPDRDQAWRAIERALKKESSPVGVTLGEARGLVRARVGMRSLLSKAFARDGPAWLRRHRVTFLEVSGTTKDWGKLLRSPAGRVRGLVLPSIGDVGLKQLAAVGSPTLASLDLRRSLPGQGAKALGESAGFPGLCRLDLSWTRLPLAGLRAVLSGPCSGSLRHLDLGSNYLKDIGVAVLAQSPGAAGLVTLGLANNGLGSQGLMALAASPHLGNLRNLDLSGVSFPEAGLAALARSALAPRLRRLGLAHAGRCSVKVFRQLADALHPECKVAVSRHSDQLADEVRELLGARLVQE